MDFTPNVQKIKMFKHRHAHLSVTLRKCRKIQMNSLKMAKLSNITINLTQMSELKRGITARNTVVRVLYYKSNATYNTATQCHQKTK